MTQSVQKFYDDLSQDYDLLFTDWHASVMLQGTTLHNIIKAQLGKESAYILDCSCGIGTQSIGLAKQGHMLHGIDLSSAAIKRAKQEAVSFGVRVDFLTGDFRYLERCILKNFDVVLSCDNALPHLLTDEDLLTAAKSMWDRLNPGGLFLASIRDYDQIVQERPQVTLPRILDDGNRIVFQAWEWQPNTNMYNVSQFIIRNSDGQWRTTCATTQYRAILRRELTKVLEQAGFSQIKWLMPDESGYYQPIILARK